MAVKLGVQNDLLGLAIPYYHKLIGNPVNDRLILRYEIYMRHYLLNMLEIGNPYAFTAIGSAMAAKVSAYRKVGGLAPVKSGEDFYFIQKLKKNGKVGNWCETTAFPSSRFSNRVIFGTGRALIKGNAGRFIKGTLSKKWKQLLILFRNFLKEIHQHRWMIFCKNNLKLKKYGSRSSRIIRTGLIL